MEAVGGIASIITLVVLASTIAKTTGNIIQSVHQAPKELVQVSNHVTQISVELECINRMNNGKDLTALFAEEEISVLSHSLTIANNSMLALQKDCEKYIHMKSRVAVRLSWALFDRKTANDYLDQLQRIESHLVFVLQILNLQGNSRAQEENTNRSKMIFNKIEDYHGEVLRLSALLTPKPQPATSTIDPESLTSFRHRKTVSLSDYWKHLLSIHFRLSTAENNFQTAYELHARVPIISYRGRMAFITNFSIRRLSTFLPNITLLGGGLNFVNIVPMDSEIVLACQSGDLLAVRDLFLRKEAAPNDMTIDEHDRSLLYYAAQSGSTELIQFLIRAGAPVQPNQLLAAAYWRNPDAARLLLLAGANVDHMGSDGFTIASYLYGKSRPKNPQTEFIEMLSSNSFSHFNAQTNNGWTVLHRAAAWGTAADVKTLAQMKTSVYCRSKILNWTPVFCAVCYKNCDTMQELWDCYDDIGMKDHVDFRGWNLLHIAAGYGNCDAVPFLIKKGVDVTALSEATARFVPAPLRGRRVTPGDVARCCGEKAYKDWAQALQVAGCPIDVQPDDIDWDSESVVEAFGECECCDKWN